MRLLCSTVIVCCHLQDVVIQDVADFFVDHAVSDNLGVIANAHLALADQSKDVSLPLDAHLKGMCDPRWPALV